MARVVCQVLQRPEEVTFIWSQDQASFEPYHLSGAEARQFYDAARQARAQLAAMLEGNQTQEALAKAGHELYRLIFRLGSAGGDGGSAGQVRQWLDELRGGGGVESLEVLSDLPGQVPWNVVCEQSPSGEPGVDGFWGLRYPLATGRRVNPLRLDPVISEPDVLLVLDPGASAEEQSAWGKEAEERQWRLATSPDKLQDILEEACPDLIIWVGRCRAGGLVLGDDKFGLDELRSWIDTSREGNLEPLLWLQAEADSPANWEDVFQRAALSFPGLISWQEPITPAVAGSLGREAVRDLLAGGKSLSQTLRELRQKHGWPALALTALCPAEMCLAESQVAPTSVLYDLPDEPYPALCSLDRGDRPLLGGRDRDIYRFAGLIDQSAGKLLVLHGGFGVGKASFLRAGVLAFLEDDSVGYLALRDRTADGPTPESEVDYPILAIRATQDVAGQLAEALCVYCDQPYRYTTPLGGSVAVALPGLLSQSLRGLESADAKDTSIQAGESGSMELGGKPSTPSAVDDAARVDAAQLWQAFENNPDQLGRVLDSLSRRLPTDLVIVIEQAEELITQAREPEDEARRRRALAMLVRAAEMAPRCKLILSLRTDFLGRLLDDLPDSGLEKIAEYCLPELSRDQLLEILLLPTVNAAIPFTDEVPFTKYSVAFPETVAARLVDQVLAAAPRTRQSAVALLQTVAARLRYRARMRNVQSVSEADIVKLGIIEALPRTHTEERLKSLRIARASKFTLRKVLRDLCTGEADGTVVRDLVSMEETIELWRPDKRPEAEKALAEAEDAGLLTSQFLMVDGHEDTFVSLPNDTVARVAQDWSEERYPHHQQAWKTGMIDTLWVTIPLMCVTAALAHFFTRTHYAPTVATAFEDIKKLKDESDRYSAQVQAMQMPKYLGFVLQADEAWQAGNMIRMRQLLLSQQVKPRRPGDNDPRRDEDLRGFEWYYLWRLANSEKHALPGHEAPVAAVALSPDGSVIATGSTDGKLFLWDYATGTKRATLIGHVGAVNALAFSSNGKALFSAGADKVIREWDAMAGKDKFVYVDKPNRSLSGHSDAVLALAFNKNGTLASAGADKTIILWDEKFDQRKLTDHAAAVQALAMSSDGKLLASGDADGKVLIWDPANAKKLHSKDASPGTIRALAFSPDSKLLLSGGSETRSSLAEQNVGAIRIWDAATGTLRTTPEIAHGREVFALAFSPDGKLLASAGKDNFVRLWDADSFQEIGPIKGHLGWVRSLAFAPNSQSLVSGSYDALVKVWQPAPSESSDVLKAGTEPLASVVISGDNKYLAAAGKEGSVHVWSLGTNKLLQTLKSLKGPVTSLVFGDDAGKVKLAAAARLGKDEGAIQVWDIGDDKGAFFAKEASTLPLKGRIAECLAFAPDGRALAFGGSAKSVEIWDSADAKSEPTKLGDDLKQVRSLTFGAKGQLLAAGCGDGTMRIWHLKANRELPGSPYDGHSGPVLSLAFFHEFIASASADGVVKVWVAQEGKAPFVPFWTYRGHVGSVNAVASTALGTNFLFISGGSDRTVKIWEAITGERFTLKGCSAPVRGLAIASNNSVIASTGDDGTVRLWRANVPKIRVEK